MIFELLQFHLLPIRDWNIYRTGEKTMIKHCNFTYSLLGIETKSHSITFKNDYKLQFHLLPIRDWNGCCGIVGCWVGIVDCNFTYSLLGIETPLKTGRLE